MHVAIIDRTTLNEFNSKGMLQLHVHPRDMTVTKGDDVSLVRHGSKTRGTLALTPHFRLAGKRKSASLDVAVALASVGGL